MSKHSKYILLVFFYLIFGFTKAQNNISLFQTANKYYQNKQYEEAEKMYLLLLKKENNNANANYNLGNTYFHLKQYTNAILYYEKAKKIEPDNKQIQHNIDLTNNKLFSKIEFSKTFFVTKKIKGFAHTKSADTWSIYLLVSLWIGIVLICIHFLKNKQMAFNIGATTLLFAMLFAYFTYTTYKSEQLQDFAIVMTNDATLNKMPVANIGNTDSIQSGTKVQIIDSDKSWLKIKLPNDKIGWISIDKIARI